MTRRSSRTIGTALGCGAVSVLTLGTSVAATVDDESTTTTDTDADTDTETAVTGFPDDFALPPGYTMLIDSTGQLTVAVPDSWTDIDLRPDSADGALVPRINAATNLDLWRETFDAPGVLYAAFPYTDDEEALYRDQVDWQDGCTSEEIVPYDDGAFVGEWRQLTDCGSAGQAELHVVVASPASEDVTVIVVVQLAGPQDQAVLEAILQSFNFTPTATWPATSTTDLATTTSSTTDLATTTSSTTTIPGEPASSVPAGTFRLESNAGVLSVQAPDEWEDADTGGGVNDDGSYRPTIAAAPSLEDFGPGFDHPGLLLLALPPDTDPAEILANARQPENCETGPPAPFDNGELTGLSQTWSACTGGTMDVVIVSARPPDSAFTLYARVQEEPGGGLTAPILDSISVPDSTAYPSALASASDVTVSGSVPDSLLQGPVQPQSFLVVDSTRQLRIQVPAAWRDVRLHPSFNDDATARPRIVASLHIETLLAQWGAPGVVFLEFPYVDAATYLANQNLWTPGCTEGGTQSFDDGTYHGLMHTWLNCDETDTRLLTVVVSPSDNSATLVVEIYQPTADDTALKSVLASFGQL